MAQRLALIREVNPPRVVKLPVNGSFNAEQTAVLNAAVREVDRLRSREAGVHALVTGLLLRWLSELSGSSEREIIGWVEDTLQGLLPDESDGIAGGPAVLEMDQARNA